jgi:hypothetical protein
MARRKPAFSQYDVARALKGMAAAKFNGRVRVEPDGAISIVPLDSQPEQPQNELDEWKARRARSA